MKEKDIIDRLQMEALGVNVYPYGDNQKTVNRHGIQDLPTVPPMPQRTETPERPLSLKEETPEDARRVIENAGAAATMNINNMIEGKNIEKELAGIRKELHTLNTILERWMRRWNNENI